MIRIIAFLCLIIRQFHASAGIEYMGPQPFEITHIDLDEQQNIYITARTDVFGPWSAWVYKNETWQPLVQSNHKRIEEYRARTTMEHYYRARPLGSPSFFIRSTNGGLDYTTLTQTLHGYEFGPTRILGEENDIFYYSNNNGDSWTTVTVTTESVILSPPVTEGSTALIVADGERLFLSNNEGTNWIEIPAPPVGVEEGITRISLIDGVIYAPKGSGAGPPFLYVSRNRGITWERQSIQLAVAVKPVSYGAYVLAGDSTKVYIASKANLDWRDLGISPPQGTWFNCLAIRGNELLLGTAVGLYKYVLPNSARHWNLLE